MYLRQWPYQVHVVPVCSSALTVALATDREHNTSSVPVCIHAPAAETRNEECA